MLVLASGYTQSSQSHNSQTATGVSLHATPAPAGSSTNGTDGPLTVVNNSAWAYEYQLEAARTCRIGDGLTLVRNLGAAAITLENITANVVDSHTVVGDQLSYEVVAVAPRTQGELASSFTLVSLAHGVKLGSGVGTTLPAESAKNAWYALVALLTVASKHAQPWMISGLTVTYLTGGRSVTTTFKQNVRLPALANCT
jgi:hypothetical protein